MANKTNETVKTKKHTGIKVAVVTVILAVVLECCFNTKDYSETPVESSSNSVVATETEESETIETESEATEVETETAETEETVTTDSALDAEVEAELLAEEGIYITPGSTFYTTEGGYDNNRTLYLNVLYEDDNTMRYVGWGYDEAGNIDESVHVDILMKQTDTTTKWLSEDGLWGASYLTDDIVYVGQESVWDSDFMGSFSRVPAEESSASTTSSEEVTVLNSNSEFREFIRDESNIGKVATVDIYAAETSADPFYASTLWNDGEYTYLYIQNNSSTTILHGDYATITGVFKGFKYGEALFEATSIELLDVN